MGNCLAHQENLVRVMKTDGKILEYKAPIRVHQVLSEFNNHAISDRLPVVKHMLPSDEMFRGHMYYLLPLPAPLPPKKKKPRKTVRFSDDVVAEKGGEARAAAAATGVVRIKVVISKQELQAMLGGKEGAVSVEEMISQSKVLSAVDRDGDVNIGSKGFLPPALPSVPEVN